VSTNLAHSANALIVIGFGPGLIANASIPPSIGAPEIFGFISLAQNHARRKLRRLQSVVSKTVAVILKMTNAIMVRRNVRPE
jgi:hypothetical protein